MIFNSIFMYFPPGDDVSLELAQLAADAIAHSVELYGNKVLSISNSDNTVNDIFESSRV